MLRYIIPVVLIGAVFASVQNLNLSPKEEKVEHLLTQVIQKDFQLKIPIKGKMGALRAETITNPLDGGREITWIIPEGSIVQEGDVILKFDTSNLEHEVRTKELELKLKLAEKAEAVATMQAEESQMKLDASSLETDIAINVLEQKELDSLPDPEELAIKQREFESAKDILTATQKEYDRLSKGRNRELTDDKEIRQLELQLVQKNSSYRKADLEYYLTKLGAFYLDVDDLKLQRQMAETKLKDLQGSMPNKLKKHESKVQQIDAQIESAENALKDAREALEQAHMKAPSGGLIVYRSIWGQKITIGSSYRKGMPLIDIPDLGKMELKGRVLESLISFVKKKQEVQIQVDGIPEKSFTGKIRKISKVAVDISEREVVGFFDTKKDTGVKVFEVFVKIDQKNSRLLPRMSASGEILSTIFKNALIIPSIAVFTEEKQQYVWLWQNEKLEKRTVKVLVDNKMEAVIESGLQKGDQVALKIESF